MHPTFGDAVAYFCEREGVDVTQLREKLMLASGTAGGSVSLPCLDIDMDCPLDAFREIWCDSIPSNTPYEAYMLNILRCWDAGHPAATG